MSISIITPHFNDLEGIKQTYDCLIKQKSEQWEWIIVDDYSDADVRVELKAYFTTLSDRRIKYVLNTKKSNASVCRNLGAKKATYQHLVFLDSDDLILENFISNRLIDFNDFVVYKNFNLLDSKGNSNPFPSVKSNYLDCFLQAKFVWQTSSVLWKKEFLIKIGAFNPKLKRLQDVELAIRALQHSANYQVIDNPVDFYYRVKPIRERKNFVQPVCEAVYLFISELLDTTMLDKYQLKLLTGYYYLCTKYLERSGDAQEVSFVQKNLKLFYKKRYLGFYSYLMGFGLLQLYRYKLISGTLFLKLNRRLFKP